MEIKTYIEKPYSNNERMNFIVEYNHNQGYEIRETEDQLQAWGYTEAEKQQTEEQKEIERKSKLKMTKRDFFLYVLQPYEITYAALLDLLNTNDTLKACYDGCNYIYRYDEMLLANIKTMLETLCGQTFDEDELNAHLDEIFEEHNAKD